MIAPNPEGAPGKLALTVENANSDAIGIAIISATTSSSNITTATAIPMKTMVTSQFPIVMMTASARTALDRSIKRTMNSPSLELRDRSESSLTWKFIGMPKGFPDTIVMLALEVLS